MRTRITLAGIVATLALLTAACSGDDDGTDLDAYAQAIADSVLADQDEDTVEASPNEALCIGVAVAAEIGLERLREEGSPADLDESIEGDLAVFELSDARALEIADRYIACIPDIVDQFVDLLDAGEDADCVASLISADDLRKPTATQLQGDDATDDLEFAFDALDECGSRNPDLETYIDAIAASTLGAAGTTLGISDAEATCFAENMVTVIGPSRLAAVGDADAFVDATAVDLSAIGLTSAELELIAAGYFDCSPTVAAEFRSLFLTGTGLSGEQRDCVDELISDEILIDIIAASLGGQPPESAVVGLDAQLASCS